LDIKKKKKLKKNKKKKKKKKIFLKKKKKKKKKKINLSIKIINRTIINILILISYFFLKLLLYKTYTNIYYLYMILIRW